MSENRAELTGLQFNLSAKSDAPKQIRKAADALKDLQKVAEKPIRPEIDTKPIKEGAKEAKEAMKGLGAVNSTTSTKGLFSGLKTGLKTGFYGATKALYGMKLGIGATSQIVRLFTVPEKAALKLTKTIGSKLTGKIKQATKSVTHFGRRFTAVLSYRAFRRFIGEIYKGLTQGKENLYQWDKLMGGTFSQSMDKIATSALYLKNAIGTLAEPLINVVTPAFEKFTDVAVSGINAVAEGLAIITGSDAWTKATKAAKEYGKETGKLAGIDELHIIGSGEGDITQMFEKAKVNKDLKDLFDSGRFEDFGKEIAKKLNQAVKAMDKFFDELRVKGVKAAKTAARIGNGIVDAFGFYSLGKAAGKGLNALTDTVNTFLETFNFKRFGSGIMNSVNGFFDQTEWDLLGRTFANGWNAFIHTAQGVIQTASPFKYGKKLSEMVIEWAGTVDWEAAGQTLGNGITKLFYNISAFFQNKPITEVAKGISTFLNNAIHETNWEAVGQGLSDFFGDAASGLAELVDKTDWEALGEGVGKMLGEIEWGKHLVSFGQSLAKAFFGVISGLFDTETGTVALQLAGAVTGMFAGLTVGGPVGAVVGALSGAKLASDVGDLTRRVKGRAYGGTVPTGDLFYASERGPEYVGTLGGTQTAVANNASIIEGVKQGVMQAILSAGSIQTGQTGGVIHVQVDLDGRKVGEANVDYINGETRRTGRSPLYSY